MNLIKERLRQFMVGRYGMDELGRFLSYAALPLVILGALGGGLFNVLAIAMLLYAIYRSLSRSHGRRRLENAAYLRIAGDIKRRIAQRKERFANRRAYRYFPCPGCKTSLRVPRGKGELTITCPKCHTRFAKKS